MGDFFRPPRGGQISNFSRNEGFFSESLRTQLPNPNVTYGPLIRKES